MDYDNLYTLDRMDYPGGIGRIYTGHYYQNGHGGVGRLLAGLWRRVFPLLKQGAKAVGKEALRTGMNVASDVSQNIPISESLKKRTKESGNNLKRKAEERFDSIMDGSGYKTPRLIGASQLPGSSSEVQIHTKNRKKQPKRKKKKSVDKNCAIKKKKIKSNKKRQKKTRTTRDIFT